MGADYPGAVWIPNSNAFSGRQGYTPRFIILHGTAGGSSAEAIANYFASTQGTANPASAHFVIGADGEIVQCNALADGAWANGYISTGHDPWWDSNINPNNITVSIEHCKPSTDNSDNLTPAQQASSFKLVAWLCQTLSIPARAADANGGITGHFSIDPVNRSRCPGPYPWDALWAFLGGGNMNVPNGWHDDGSALTAPNGHRVTSGFRQYILSNTWDPNDWPLEEEHGQSPLEISNPSLGDGTQQVFRMSVLEWIQSQNKVIKAWGGQELLAVRAKLSPLQGQISTLQAQLAASQQQVQAAQSAAPQAPAMASALKQVAQIVAPFNK